MNPPTIDALPGVKSILDKCQQSVSEMVGYPVTIEYKMKIHKIKFTQLIDIICDVCEITVAELQGNSKVRRIVAGKQLLCFFSREWLHMEAKDIARLLNIQVENVFHHIRYAKEYIEANDNFYMLFAEQVKTKILKK